ncbi:MAG TPA: glycosyltransferase family 9 protein [Acidimicrobiales bacterium]|nr:glycosyltransferase family 9 protein [Acidimicrobiales bacterium]
MLRALGLGDFLTGLPALRALAAAYPDHRRVLAAPAAIEPLARLSGAVDEVLDTAPLALLDPSRREADVAVNLHGRGPESHRVLLAAEPARLIAFAHPDVPESAGGPPWAPAEHEVTRWCRLLQASGIPADTTALDLPTPTIAPPRGTDGATVIHPGAASGARRWPVERWAAVARHQLDAGRHVVLTGSAAERALATEVAERAGLDPAATVLAGRADLLGLAATVAAAGMVLCGDTGVAHLATAFGTPSVVLFGPVPPSQWGPPADRPQHVALWAGRTGDPHAAEPDPGLLEITVADVLAALPSRPGDGGPRQAPSSVTSSGRPR